jgi:hypothetical protein
MLSVLPLRPGDCPSFYRSRRQFTGVPHYSSYVWRHGAQYNGVDGRPGESVFRRSVVACPVSAQEWLRGWQCWSLLWSRRPYADSRVRLTGGRRAHNSWCGGVLSSRTLTTSRVVMQCSRWCWDGGDGRTGPTATEVTGPAGLTSTSWRSPGQAWNRRPSPFEGSAVLFRGRDASIIREWAAQCHGTDTGHAAQRRTVIGMASPGELAEQRRGVIPRRVVAWIRLWPGHLQMSVHEMPLSGEKVWRRWAHEVLERAEPRPRGRPAPERGGTSLEGGDRPSSEAKPHPRGRPALERGKGLPVRFRAPRAKRSSARGWLGRLSGGPLGPPGPWAREFILRVF